MEYTNYLDEQNINNLFALISNDNQEISKLRNQYKENPNLENELNEME